MMLKGKNKLKKYDLGVALISPSRGTTEKKLSLAKKRLGFMGVDKLFYRENLFDKVCNYWSGSIQERAEELNHFFLREDVDLIWCLSGGYGSIDLVDKLDFENISRNKKIFIGFSDITSLQVALLHYSGIESIQFHMPGIKPWFNNKMEVNMLRNLLELKDNKVELLAGQVHTRGQANGQLVGGCLTLLCSSLGTKHELNTDGKILYIEDTNCTPQEFYNDLSHLYAAGKFDKIKGLVFSKIVNCKEYNPFLDLFLKRFEGKGFPIIKDLDGGHYKFKVPIVLGGKCNINPDNGEIIFGFSDEFKKTLFYRKKESKENRNLFSSFNEVNHKSLKEMLNHYKANDFLITERIELNDFKDRDVLSISSPIKIKSKNYLVAEFSGKNQNISDICVFEKKEDSLELSFCLDFGLSRVKVIKVGADVVLTGYNKEGLLEVYSGSFFDSFEKVSTFSDKINNLVMTDLNGKVGVFYKRGGGFYYLEVGSIFNVSEEELIGGGERIIKFNEEDNAFFVSIIHLKEGKLGILGHMSRKSNSGNYFYYPFVFSFDPKFLQCSSIRLILRRGELPEFDSNSLSEYNMIIPGGLTRENGQIKLYCSVGNSKPYSVTLKDFFNYYESRG